MRRNIGPDAHGTFVLTRGLEKCLYAYPLDEWKKLEGGISNLQQASDQDRFYLRMLMQWSEELVADSQYRLLIPHSLLEFADIKKEVYFIGVIDHIELWNPADFKRYIESMKKSYESVAEQVLGIKQVEG